MISVVGTVAMLWVGGHILLAGVDELGWHAPYDAVHHLEEDVHHAVVAASARSLGWLVNTLASAVVGLVVGAVVVAVMHVLPIKRGGRALTSATARGRRPAGGVEDSPGVRRSRGYAGTRRPAHSSHRGHHRHGLQGR